MLHIEHQGVTIPKLGLGTWLLRFESCVDAVQHALVSGYRHIDTAQIYENEADVAEGIAKSGVSRGDIFLTTKIWRENVAPGALEASLEESLRKLRTDYVDLLLIHWPVEDVPFAAQMEALQKVQEQGKTRLIGVSNFTSAQVTECVEQLGVPLVTNQVEYHPYLSQKPMLDFCEAHDMFLTAYSPLGRAKLGKDKTLLALAGKHGKSVGQVILRWHMQQPSVVAIPKAGSKAHIEANLDIFDFVLSDEEMGKITALAKHNTRFVDPDFAPRWDAPQAAA